MAHRTIIALLGLFGTIAVFGAQPTASNSLPEDLAGNEAVREHMRRFKGRGQLVEEGVKALSPRETLQRLKVPDGLEIQLVASEPTIRQPVCINFDERGRIWVAQYLQYPFPAGL